MSRVKEKVNGGHNVNELSKERSLPFVQGEKCISFRYTIIYLRYIVIILEYRLILNY